MSDVPSTLRAPLPSGGIPRFLAGLATPLDALGWILRERALLRIALIPSAINAALAVALATLAILRADDLVGAWFDRPDDLRVVAWWILVAGVAFLGVLIAGALAMGLGSIIAAPFSDRLTARVEVLLTGVDGTHPDAPGGIAGDVLDGVANSLRNLALWLVLLVPILSLNLLPGLGSVLASAGAAALTAAMLVLEHIDWAMSRRRVRWKERVAIARRLGPLGVGLGIGLTALLAVPILNLVLLPVAAVAGTILVVRLETERGAPFSRDPR